LRGRRPDSDVTEERRRPAPASTPPGGAGRRRATISEPALPLADKITAFAGSIISVPAEVRNACSLLGPDPL
jgi:hypothetical protein